MNLWDLIQIDLCLSLFYTFRLSIDGENATAFARVSTTRKRARPVMFKKNRGKTRMNKSEIKRAYKQSKRPMGVYRIVNSQSDKVYIGFATDLEARFNRHKAELKFGSHRNEELQKIWNSYGESALEFEILDVLDQEEGTQASPNEELHILTEMWIQKLKKTGDSIVRL